MLYWTALDISKAKNSLYCGSSPKLEVIGSNIIRRKNLCELGLEGESRTASKLLSDPAAAGFAYSPVAPSFSENQRVAVAAKRPADEAVAN